MITFSSKYFPFSFFSPSAIHLIQILHYIILLAIIYQKSYILLHLFLSLFICHFILTDDQYFVFNFTNVVHYMLNFVTVICCLILPVLIPSVWPFWYPWLVIFNWQVNGCFIPMFFQCLLILIFVHYMEHWLKFLIAGAWVFIWAWYFTGTNVSVWQNIWIALFLHCS